MAASHPSRTLAASASGPWPECRLSGAGSMSASDRGCPRLGFTVQIGGHGGYQLLMMIQAASANVCLAGKIVRDPPFSPTECAYERMMVCYVEVMGSKGLDLDSPDRLLAKWDQLARLVVQNRSPPIDTSSGLPKWRATGAAYGTSIGAACGSLHLPSGPRPLNTVGSTGDR